MVVRDRFPLTLAALASLRSNLPGDVELILVDSGSTDETRQIDRYVRGAQLLRFDTDIGLLRGGNAALTCVTRRTLCCSWTTTWSWHPARSPLRCAACGPIRASARSAAR